MTNNLNNEHFQNKYSLGSKFKEKINQLFYYHGLTCSRHPYLLIIFSILLFCFCCYPIFGIHLFQNDFSQQFVTDFDTFRYLNNLNSSSYDELVHNNMNSDNLSVNQMINLTNVKKILRKAPKWVSNLKKVALSSYLIGSF